MNRRSGIKTLMIISAGALLLPSCRDNDRKASVALKHLPIRADDEELITALADSILPEDDTPGAKSVAAHEFVLLMMDDCYAPADQQRFVKGMKSFRRFAGRQINETFSKATPGERRKILVLLEKGQSGDSDIDFFYKTVKQLTVRAFTQSKYYLTEVQHYAIAPGRYYGCVTLNNPG